MNVIKIYCTKFSTKNNLKATKIEFKNIGKTPP